MMNISTPGVSMDSAPRKDLWQHAVPVSAFVLLALIVLFLYRFWSKPLLWDEFVYFAPAGLPGTRDALQAMSETATNLNQGVTGAFFMVDFWLLKTFGAQSWALRLPGLVTGTALFVYSALFLVARRVSLWVLPAVPVIFATQELVMRYVGEARTYLPLAAASIGVLAYYSLSHDQRSTWWGRTTGWSAVLIGVTFHPYFALYWLTLGAFAYLVWGRDRLWRPWDFANVPLVVVGTVIYFALAIGTWLRGRATAEVDPFNFLPGPLPIEILVQNVYFLAESPWSVVGLIGVCVVLTGMSVAGRTPIKNIWRGVRAPVSLGILAFLLALVISASTITADFWIFPRQWIGSTAIVVLAGLWGAAEWWRVATEGISRSPKGSRIRAAGVVVMATLIVALAGPAMLDRITLDRSWRERTLLTSDARAELAANLEAGKELSDPDWVRFAQANIDSGGPVWSEFGQYYTERDWTTFVLTDGSGHH